MRLELATEEEKLSRDALTHEAWGNPLSVSDWAERERRLRAHRWSREEMTTYFLRADDGAVLSSCETFRMHSWVAPSESAREPGFTWGVASVYTERALRGRGHAATLLQLLHEQLRNQPSAQAVILFSEVGPSLYGRIGYASRDQHNQDRVWTALAGDPREGVHAVLTDDEIWEALDRLQTPEDRFVVWPTATQLDWHRERERVYSDLLRKPRPPGAGAWMGRAGVFWCADYRKSELRIVLLVAQTPDEASALIRSARRAAHRAQLSTVCTWETPWRFPVDALDEPGLLRPRPAALPMIYPLQPNVRADDWRFIPRALWV
jgi:hypothetical protein